MKIKDYPKVSTLAKEDILLVDGEQGTRTMDVETSPYKLFNHIPEMHNQIWRGKDLGKTYTNAHKTAIQDGSFNDLWIGDYWVIGGHTWRIMHFGYPLHSTDTESPTMLKPSTALIMPDQPMSNDKMNNSTADIKSKGVINSYGYTTVLPKLFTTASSAFGSGNLVQFRETLPTGSNSENGEQVDYRLGNIGLPSHGMIVGGYHPAQRGMSSGAEQLAAFRLNPRACMNHTETIWTSDLFVSGDAYSNGRITPHLKPVIYTAYTSSSAFRPFVVLG